MLKTTIELFDRKAQYYDYKRKLLKFKFDLVEEISATLNPLSERWKPEATKV